MIHSVSVIEAVDLCNVTPNLHIQREQHYSHKNVIAYSCSSMTVNDTFLCPFFVVPQFLKSDLMRQFDSQVNDFMDCLIEESATLEPAPIPAVFSPPLSDKERNKLR